MPSFHRRGPVPSWTRLARAVVRPLWRLFHVLLVALAAAFGAPPPKLLRHEDATVQVAHGEDDARM